MSGGKYRDQVENLKSHIASLRLIMGVIIVLLAASIYSWSQTMQGLRVYYPPDLRSGAVMKAGEIPASNVYAFAYYIFQQLNSWKTNGEKDYGTNIYRLSAYLTPRYREELITDLNVRSKRGELIQRIRGVSEISGHGYEEQRVDVTSKNSWIVWVDLQVEEYVKGTKVKDTPIRYPLVIRRYDVDPEKNQWGLALDGYPSNENPKRLSDSELVDTTLTHQGGA